MRPNLTPDKTNELYIDLTQTPQTLNGDQELAYEVLVGLSSVPKRLPSHLIYDDRGSELFQAIMGLPEYYPTRTEEQILRDNASQILKSLDGRPFNLVDLGAGDGKKTMILLEEARRMKADFRFVPIDISKGAMQGLVTKIADIYPDIPMQGIVAEYTAGVRWLAQHSRERSNLVLFLGSNIGNFGRANARGFLSRLWAAMHVNDRILIGFDLKKDIDRLLSAYNDSQGVTAEFNLNLLDRLNRELDADFDRNRWRHYGTYNVFSGAMESYLVSMEHQTVHIDRLERLFTFEAWEPIHTEYSYKYLTSDIDSLSTDSGFRMENRFLDDRGWFSDDLWAPIKKPDEPSF